MAAWLKSPLHARAKRRCLQTMFRAVLVVPVLGRSHTVLDRSLQHLDQHMHELDHCINTVERSPHVVSTPMRRENSQLGPVGLVRTARPSSLVCEAGQLGSKAKKAIVEEAKLVAEELFAPHRLLVITCSVRRSSASLARGMALSGAHALGHLRRRAAVRHRQAP